MKGSDGSTLDLIRRVGRGDRVAMNQLMPILYAELRQLAERQLARKEGELTMQPTQLVHETYLKLLEGAAPDAGSRTEFLAIAAGAMRHLLIDQVRARRAAKRGGGWRRVTCSVLAEDGGKREELDLLALDEALRKIAELDERQAKIVELRFFGGLSGEEIADHLGVSRNTVVRDLTAARLWLARELRS